MIKKRVAMLLLLVVSLPFCIFADETNPDGEISNITIPERSSRKVEPKAGKTTLFVAGDSIDRAGRLRITPEPADTSALAADSIQQSVIPYNSTASPKSFLVGVISTSIRRVPCGSRRFARDWDKSTIGDIGNCRLL